MPKLWKQNEVNTLKKKSFIHFKSHFEKPKGYFVRSEVSLATYFLLQIVTYVAQTNHGIKALCNTKQLNMFQLSVDFLMKDKTFKVLV